MNETFNYCHVVGKTDVGRKRVANEDNMYNAVTQNGLVSVVCDGMGGHVGGATASKIAVSAIIENLNNVYYDDPRIAIGESIDKANKSIIQKTVEKPELAGMGSTCVLLLVRDGKVYIGHVGDSRIYLVRSKRIVQLTKDHSYVQMLVDCGEITKEQAEHHPRKNEITNALGIPNMTPATVADDAIIPEAGDCFVLCSDGLSGMVSDDTICKIISRQSEMNAQERVDRLVALANENGGIDNITVQLVEFSVSPNAITDGNGEKNTGWIKMVSAVSVLLILGVGGYFLLREKPILPMPDDGSKTENVITTRSVTNLGTVYFKEYGKIVEFSITEASLKFIINNREKDSRTENNVSLDLNSLKVLTPNISRDNTNTWLAFTDKNPGSTVEFSFMTLDKAEEYRYKIDVKNIKKDGGLSITKDAIPEKKGKKTKEESLIKEEVAKVDTFYIRFKYNVIKKESRLLLNYSAKPVLIFNGKEEKINGVVIGKILDDFTYNDLYWKPELNKGQCSFIFRGEKSDIKHSFIIPCAVKETKKRIVISVELVPNRDAKDDEVTSNGEEYKGEIIGLQYV